MKRTEKPVYCRACRKDIHLDYCRLLFEKSPVLCDECLSKVIVKCEKRKIKNVDILFLSEYDGFLKQMLMEYKEYGNIELAPCFLSVFYPLVRLCQWNSLIVPCPSSSERIEKRGFDHLETMLSCSNLKFASVLEQRTDKEQKWSKGSSRLSHKGIAIKDNCDINSDKSIVLFDDVYTSGATFFQSYEALKSLGFKKIKGLILMDNDGSIRKRIE